MTDKKRYLKVILGILFIFFIGVFLIRYDGISYLKDREKLEKVIGSLGILAPIVYIVIYIFVTISCVSALPLTVAGGILFGPVLGIIYTALGAGIGLSLSFLIARYIMKDYIERKFGNSEILKKIQMGIKSQGWFILAITRLLPIFPFGIQNYIYGLTEIGFLKYSILSTIFILPGTTVFILLAGAISSGDLRKAIKLSLIASIIFLSLIIIGKIIGKKYKYK